ncbi:MAG: PEP-utilizing enzyme [Candidatus Magasanikbacteria bacterium]
MNYSEEQQIPPLTRWLEEIGADDVEDFIKEDGTRTKRLQTLKSVLNLPINSPEDISTEDIIGETRRLKKFLKNHGNQKIAVRLIPKNKNLKKIRIRDIDLNEYINDWLPKQDIDIKEYTTEILHQNNEISYSCIFLINEHGVWGDITEGVHWQLSDGIYEKTPITFYFDFYKWLYITEGENRGNLSKYIKILNKAIKKLLVKKDSKREKLKKIMGAEFNNKNYLKGYFEFLVWPNKKIVFNDYSGLIYKKLKNVKFHISNKDADLKGIASSPGKTQGIIKIISDPINQKIGHGDILVCQSIDNINFLPLVKKASAVITEKGNILSHFSIVCRELRKPCIVEVRNATQKLKNGQFVRIDADEGLIFTDK